MTARDDFIRCANRSVGGRYCSPPQEPRCTDCSGLVRRCFLEATGQEITGDSHRQYELGRVVSGATRSGDLIFFNTGFSYRGNAASHVGIYVGDGQMANALNENAGIVRGPVDTDYWRPLRIGSRRYFDDAGDVLVQLGGAAPEPPAGIEEPADDPPGTRPARPPRRGPDRERTRDRRRFWQRAVDQLRRRRVR